VLTIDLSVGNFSLVGIGTLPERSGGDGLADVFLGHATGTLFVTDRTDGVGKLYMYTIDADGTFDLTHTFDTGATPRYTASNSRGDIVSCSHTESTAATYVGLLNDVDYYREMVTESIAIQALSFFLETDVLRVPDRCTTPGPTVGLR
jgi:hypothetical protein